MAPTQTFNDDRPAWSAASRQGFVLRNELYTQRMPAKASSGLGNMFSLTSKNIMAYEERGMIMIKVKINGQERDWDGDPDLHYSGFSVMKSD